ncbi:MAG TPA: ATP-binding protein [Vicinamibacterales bacterium]|nr:ATP-binding protein [Vicinamibacterales bacterium]
MEDTLVPRAGWRKPPLPANELERLRALRSYEIVGTAPEQSFEDLTWLASEICGTPIALVSLIEEERQWFKSVRGLDVQETSRDASFCAHALITPQDLLVVPDAADDDRFAGNPLVVADPKIRFYAGAPLVSPEGHALGTLCVIDRTPRHLSERQRQALGALARQVMTQMELRRKILSVEETRAQLMTALDAVPAAIIILRAPQGQVVLQNKGAVTMLGVPPDEQAQGRFWQDLTVWRKDGTVAPREEWATMRALAGETVVGQELLLSSEHGARLPILLTAAPIRTSAGRVIGSIGTFQDISTLSELARLKDEFVATVSHELRTPLTSIKGSLQLLISDGSNRNEEEHELLGIALGNADRLIRMINDILDVAKIEAGRLTLDRRRTAIGALFAETLGNAESLAREAHVTLDARIDPGLPALDVDPDRIVQALLNLVSNALKFAPAGSVVSLNATRGEQPDTVELSVVDRGAGIPASKIGGLFQKFSQLQGSSTHQGRGTGLGLTITKALVEQHGGSITVISAPGTGTTFNIVLPVEAAAVVT